MRLLKRKDSFDHIPYIEIAMKYLSGFFIVVFICSLSYSAIAQKGKLYLEPTKHYSKGSIYIKRNLIPITAKNISLANDTILNYTDATTGEVKAINPYNSSVNYIKVKAGTRVGEFALLGAALGLTSSLVAWLSTGYDYGFEETADIGLILTAGFTVGFGAIGGVVGMFTPKYRNLYLKDKYNAYRLEISPTYYRGQAIGLGLHVTF
jgi:hypothetical protein